LQKNLERIILKNLEQDGGVSEVQVLLNHGIAPWTLKKIITSIRKQGYRMSSDRLFVDIEYSWLDSPNKW
jgi:hypothetical protein